MQGSLRFHFIACPLPPPGPKSPYTRILSPVLSPPTRLLSGPAWESLPPGRERLLSAKPAVPLAALSVRTPVHTPSGQQAPQRQPLPLHFCCSFWHLHFCCLLPTRLLLPSVSPSV